MFALAQSAPLADRLRYSPASVNPDELIEALAELDRLQAWINASDPSIDTDSPLDEQIEAIVDKRIEKDCPDHAAYVQFFDDCFESLDAHYPCPEVTSRYDRSVIFDAIRKGEEARAAEDEDLAS